MTQTAAPVLQNERADILDILRGFALLGVMLDNLFGSRSLVLVPLVLCHYLSWPYWFLFLVGLRRRPSNQKI